jgi:hypothetical protein
VITALVAAVALTVSPARVDLVGAGTQMVRVTNTGTVAAVLDVTRAGFALDLHGRPRIVKASAAWLAFTPRRLSVAAGHSAMLTVRTRVPRGLAPGDHPGLLLLTQHPLATGGLAVRTRIGVVVSLRVPGRVVHRLVVSGVSVAGRVVRVSLINRGNVTEVLPPALVTVTLWRGQKLLARFHPAARELLPRARGVFDLRYVGGRRPLSVRIAIHDSSKRPLVERSFTL